VSPACRHVAASHVDSYSWAGRRPRCPAQPETPRWVTELPRWPPGRRRGAGRDDQGGRGGRRRDARGQTPRAVPTAVAGTLALRRRRVGNAGPAFRFGTIGAAGAVAGAL